MSNNWSTGEPPGPPSEENDKFEERSEMVFIGIMVGVLIACAVVWVIMHGGTHNPDIAPNVPGIGN